jgi:hypothetical protein
MNSLLTQRKMMKRYNDTVNRSTVLVLGAAFVSACTFSRVAAPVEVPPKGGDTSELAATVSLPAEKKLIWGLDPSLCHSNSGADTGIERLEGDVSSCPSSIEKYARYYRFQGVCKKGVLSAGLPGEGAVAGWCWDYECTCEYHSGNAQTPPVKVQFVVEEAHSIETATNRLFERCMRGGEELPRSPEPSVTASECASTKACVDLGRRRMFDGRLHEAVEFFKSGCAAKEVDACRSLVFLILSEDFPRTATHVELIKWANRQSSEGALKRFYGRLLLHGVPGEFGIEKDADRGTRILDSQCGWGEHLRDGVACAILSQEYERGHTTPIDPERVKELRTFQEKYGLAGP